MTQYSPATYTNKELEAARRPRDQRTSMGLSETILAAMIGAVATVTAALFQLFSALRTKSKSDPRPLKGMTLRSVLAALALMVASAAGGFLYSEFIKQRSGEDLRAMRQELKELRAMLAESREQVRDAAAAAAAANEASVPVLTPVAEGDVADSVESIAYVPACRRNDATMACEEDDAQRIALCGTVPAYARVEGIDLFAQPDAVQHPWEEHRATFEEDLGGARFTGKSFEYAQGNDLKAVCVNFMQWSSEHPHIARILVHYSFRDVPRQPETVVGPSNFEASGTSPPTIVAADSQPVITGTPTVPAAGR
ncbi:MAG TPA: hypothetical protein VF193_00275 [Steroidobacter sp.]